MTQALDLVLALILGLFRLVMAAIGAVEDALRRALAGIGLPAGLRELALLVALAALALLALRLFGRLFAALIALFLVLLLVHAIAPGLGAAPPAAR